MIKFLLLGHGRTGSNILVKGLAEHPRVRIGGELFHLEEEQRKKTDPNPRRSRPPESSASRYYRDNESGADFLREAVFYERDGGDALAVGFKIFYNHARDNPNVKTAWDYLIGDRSIRVIHLKRRNLLESFISLKIALITKEWRRWQGTSTPPVLTPPFRLGPEECDAYFNQMNAYRLWAASAFRDHALLKVEYERDICTRFEANMHAIHDFLGVPREPAQPLLEKQALRSPREQVLNYDELKWYFRHTLYEEYFD